MPVRRRENPFGLSKPETPHGEIVVLVERCKGCGFCIEYCPHHVLVTSPKFNLKGYHPPEVKNPELCINCGFCRMICPEFAIYTYESKTGEKP